MIEYCFYKESGFIRKGLIYQKIINYVCAIVIYSTNIIFLTKTWVKMVQS